MQKMIAFTLCAAAVLSLTACGAEQEQNSRAPQEQKLSSEAEAALPNPFTDCETLDQAAGLAGFAITVPESVAGGLARKAVRAMDKQMIEVIYEDEENTKEVRIRKAPGSGDISGDYTSHPESSLLESDGLEVTVKGPEGMASTAVWTSGDYAFSITAAPPLTSEEMLALAKGVK